MTAKSMGSYIPKYVQIQDYILQKIEEGVFGAGDRLPSEAELSRQFHVSRITVNTAIRDLSGKGVVERIQGKGTFVREARRADKSGSIAFFGKIGVPPMEESALKHHSLEEHGIIRADSLLCSKLGQEEGAYVSRIVRRAGRADSPAQLDYSYIPLSVCSNHTFDRDALEHMFLHDYICRYLDDGPSCLKIVIHTEATKDMDITAFYGDGQREPFIWDTVVCKGEHILGLTTTVCAAQKNQLFMTLEFPRR